MAINNITLGEDQPLSNDLKPIKVGGEASILEISSPLPDGSDSGQIKVNGDLDITGTLKTKLSHDLIYDFDDEVNTLAQAKVDALIDSAPAALDTLNELAAALNDDASFSTTITNSLALKAPLAAPAFTGNATFDSTTLAIDATNNRVGIGTTSPARRLDVTDSAIVSSQFASTSANGHIIDLIHNHATDGYNGFRFYEQTNFRLAMSHIQTGTRGYLQVGTNWEAGSEIFVVDGDNSRVGIGTASPDTELHVMGETSIQPVNYANNQDKFLIKGGAGNNDAWDGHVGVKMKSNGSGVPYLTLRGTNNDTLNVISSKVGIGTDSPTEPLEVWSANSEAYHYPIVARNPYNNNTPNIEYGVGIKLQLDDGSENKWASIAYETDSAYGNSGDLQFYVDGYTNSTPRMTLQHEGNLGIGTDSPSTKLEVDGDITANELILSGTSAGISINSDSDTEIFFNTTNNANIKSQGSMYLLAAASQKLYLGANNTNAQVALDNGKLGIGIDSPTTTLDVEGTVSYKSFNLTSSTDALDVSGATTVTATSTSGNIILGGFANGVSGQIIHVIHRSPTNSLRFEHNEATATQPIFTSTSADKTLSGYGGMTLFCDGSNWFEIGN